MTMFNSGVPVSSSDNADFRNVSKRIELYEQAIYKIEVALAKGAGVVKTLEIRGRVIEHKDFAKEIDFLEGRIMRLRNQSSGNRHLRPARTKARLRR